MGAIRRVLALGVTYFDTATGYGGGIGEGLFDRRPGVEQGRVFLATKTPQSRWDPAGIRAELEASLRRLVRQ